MSNPFHRILSSDVFDLPCSMGKKRRYIKLPNGGRIETDDIQAAMKELDEAIAIKRKAGRMSNLGTPVIIGTYKEIFSLDT